MVRITSVFLRDVLDQYDKEEITISRFAEILNEKATKCNKSEIIDTMEIYKMASIFMSKTIGGGSAGYIRYAYIEGCTDMAIKINGVKF